MGTEKDIIIPVGHQGKWLENFGLVDTEEFF